MKKWIKGAFSKVKARSRPSQGDAVSPAESEAKQGISSSQGTAQEKLSKLSTRIERLMPVFVVFALADLATDAVAWLFHEIPDSIKGMPGSVEVAIQAPALKKTLLNDLLAHNFFDPSNFIPGQFGQAVSEEELDPAKAVASKLGYKVVGTIVFSDADKSLVTLSKGKDIKSFFKDETLETDYRIWGIERTKVYLVNVSKNILEYLELEIEPKGLATQTSSLAPSTPSKKGPSPKEISQVSETQFTVEKAFIQDKLNNLQELLTQAKASPTGDGFKIEEIAPGSLYEAIGIREGDVITGVNDRDVKTQADAILLYNQFKSATSSRIQIRIKRGGQDMTIGYDLK
jgi:general secretion pathway protein C